MIQPNFHWTLTIQKAMVKGSIQKDTSEHIAMHFATQNCTIYRMTPIIKHKSMNDVIQEFKKTT